MSLGLIRVSAIFCLLTLFSIATTGRAAEEIINQAQQLLNENKPAEAFDLLIVEIDQRSGTPEYDLVLGIAALDSDRPTQAVFAFERVLAVDPDNTRARIELARAYFEMGENEASREEFSYASTQEIPEEVSATIEEYLTAIDARLRVETQQRRIGFYLQASAGYDSNVNSATDSSTVALPAFGNLVFTLDNSARELDSGFYQVEGGASFSSLVPGQEKLAVFGGASLFHRPTYNERNFDTSAANAQLGLRYTQDRNAFIASLQAQTYLIDEDTNRKQAGGNLQWLHTASERTQYSVFAQGLVQRFPGQRIRDVNQYSGGVGVVHLLRGKGNPVIYGSLFAGADYELIDTRPDFGRDFAGIRSGGQYSLNEHIKLIGSASYQYSRYGGDDPLFQERRRDHFVFLRGGVEYSYKQNWVLTPEVRYLLNDSSLIVNDFDRWQLLVTARYNF
jgi:tetratricopeptide (TPR) repeat protein